MSNLSQTEKALSKGAEGQHGPRRRRAVQHPQRPGQRDEAGWGGQGASAFGNLMIAWQDKQEKILRALDQLARSMQETEKDNVATDQASPTPTSTCRTASADRRHPTDLEGERDGFDGIKVEHGKLDQGSADVIAAAKDIQARLEHPRGRAEAARQRLDRCRQGGLPRGQGHLGQGDRRHDHPARQAAQRGDVERRVQGRRLARRGPFLIRTRSVPSGRSPFGAAGLGRVRGRAHPARGASHIVCSRSVSGTRGHRSTNRGTTA